MGSHWERDKLEVSAAFEAHPSSAGSSKHLTAEATATCVCLRPHAPSHVLHWRSGCGCQHDQCGVYAWREKRWRQRCGDTLASEGKNELDRVRMSHHLSLPHALPARFAPQTAAGRQLDLHTASDAALKSSSSRFPRSSLLSLAVLFQPHLRLLARGELSFSPGMCSTLHRPQGAIASPSPSLLCESEREGESDWNVCEEMCLQGCMPVRVDTRELIPGSSLFV